MCAPSAAASARLVRGARRSSCGGPPTCCRWTKSAAELQRRGTGEPLKSVCKAEFTQTSQAWLPFPVLRAILQPMHESQTLPSFNPCLLVCVLKLGVGPDLTGVAHIPVHESHCAAHAWKPNSPELQSMPYSLCIGVGVAAQFVPGTDRLLQDMSNPKIRTSFDPCRLLEVRNHLLCSFKADGGKRMRDMYHHCRIGGAAQRALSVMTQEKGVATTMRFAGDTYLRILEAAKSAVPDCHVHAFSPLEVSQGAASLGWPVSRFLQALRDAGLGSLPGTAAEVLDDEVRDVICPDKLSVAQWLEVRKPFCLAEATKGSALNLNLNLLCVTGSFGGDPVACVPCMQISDCNQRLHTYEQGCADHGMNLILKAQSV